MVRAFVGKIILSDFAARNIKIDHFQDDSAIRRISIPELYLSADACLILLSKWSKLCICVFSI
jgi:hypothetical protein